MTQRNGHHRVGLNDFKAKQRDEGLVEVEDEATGEVFILLPPAVWPREVTAARKEGDEDRLLELVMEGGAEARDRFYAAGGTALLAMTMIEAKHGASVGESSASSS